MRFRSHARLREWVDARWERWLSRRVRPAREVLLEQKNVYIMPSAQGYGFLALLLALLVAGINYENNLVFAFCFLLGGLFVVTVLYTYANVAGLRVSGVGAAPVFSGESAAFGLRFSDVAGRPHDGIEAVSIASDPVEIRVPPHRESVVMLFLPAARRGWFRPGRIRLRSYYPLGLLRAWSWVELDMACLVYPRPAPPASVPPGSRSRGEGVPVNEPGSEDFNGFRRYVPGDRLGHVEWRTLAKGQPLQTRDYSAHADRTLMLQWDDTSGATEDRLSTLCRWVLELHRVGAQYGLVLPGARIEPDSGDAHRERSLTALALYGYPP